MRDGRGPSWGVNDLPVAIRVVPVVAQSGRWAMCGLDDRGSGRFVDGGLIGGRRPYWGGRSLNLLSAGSKRKKQDEV